MASSKLCDCLRRLTRGMAADELLDWSDRELAGRYLIAGDELVFDALVRRHGPMVYRVCWRILQHPEDSEDAFQSTFLLLAQKLKMVKNRDSLASWLHGVAHRVALKSRAQAAQRRRHEQQTSKANPGSSEEIARMESRTVLHAELARLPDKLKLPLILCYLEGRTQDEAASQLGWSKSTLLRRLDEGRTALARRLAREGIALTVPVAAILLSDRAVLAELPTRLIASTCAAASCVASGKATTGLISVNVATLTRGVLETMFLTKFKAALVTVFLSSLVTGGCILICKPLVMTARAQQLGTPRRTPQADARPKTSIAGPVWRERATLRRHTDQVNAVGISADGKLLASGGQDSDVILWDLPTGKVNAILHGHSEPISCVEFSPDGTLVASGSLGLKEEKRAGQVKIWDVASGKERAVFKLGEVGGGVCSIAFSSDGKFFAASGDLGRTPEPNDEDHSFGVVTVWELATGAEKATFKEELPEIGKRDGLPVVAAIPIDRVTFSPNGKLLAINAVTKIKLVDLTTQNVVRVLKQLKQNAGSMDEAQIIPMFTTVAFSSDGKTLATTHTRAGVQLWDADTGNVRTTLAKPEGNGWTLNNSLAFSRDGKTLITVNNRNQTEAGFYVCSGEVTLWDTSTGSSMQRLPQETFVTSIALSRDGKNLAVGSRGNVKFNANAIPTDEARPQPVGDKRGTVKIWELQR